MIRTYFAKTDNEVMKFCDLALKNRLFVPGWMLSEWLVNVRKDPRVDFHNIAICQVDGITVGVSVVQDNDVIWIFVKKSYRHQGIGRRLIKCLDRNLPFSCIQGHYRGAPGSVDFFKKVGVLD